MLVAQWLGTGRVNRLLSVMVASTDQLSEICGGNDQ